MTIPPPPAELAPLAQLVGAEALFRLIDAHGGTRLYVPRRPRPDMALVQLLGMDAVQALSAEYDTTQLRVPLARPWFARCLRAQGLSHAAIARRMRTTENTVRVMLAGPPDTRQMGLPL